MLRLLRGGLPGSKGIDYALTHITANKEIDIPYSEETIREAVILLEEYPCLEGRAYRAIKAINTLTNKTDPDKWQEEAKTFQNAIKPVHEAGRLEAVLFQFPSSFTYTAENRKYLDRLLREFSGFPSVVEFQNNELSNSRVFDGLIKRGIVYVSTDLPDLQGLPSILDIATSPFSFFRLHGRNTEVRWDSENSKRFDYFYNETELKGIMERIKNIALNVDKVLVYFNNHMKGKAAQNAMS